MYYAHTTENTDKRDWQLLKDHLIQVADLASSFASDFSAEDIAYACGTLHDIGKYSDKFQKRLEGSSIRVDHSTAGAREAGVVYDKAISRIMAYIIAGHHTGLLNFGSAQSGLQERLLHSVIEDYSCYKQEIIPGALTTRYLPIRPISNRMGFSISFFIRMLYSCLVDADSLDTESFSKPDSSHIRTNYDSFTILSDLFSQYDASMAGDSKKTVINQYRKMIRDQCLERAVLSPGFFSLTVPTGGGKTLSSMAFALKHLEKNNLKRIFYVIPYTSIIEQNAQIFKNIFGEKNVLEHHSNFSPSREDDDDFEVKNRWYKMITENWDIPITVTTNVQFFESLFANKRSRCRKLHNLSKSVIILDEAQMLPTEYLKPSLQALSELVTNYGSTIVLCTATQPKIGGLLDKNLKVTEIMESPGELYDHFKRVHINHLGELSDQELTPRLEQCSQVLCIVNTRKHAQLLFDSFSDKDPVFHLSAKMCPVHRSEILKKIRTRLAEGKECRVISTQLIEAGVDVDFPVVYRAMAGVDSIAQAAGRCNREGKLPTGEVFLFNSTEKHGKPTSWQKKLAEIGGMVLESYDDPLSLPAIEEYFGKLYFYEGDYGLDQKGILALLEENTKELAFPFEDVSDAFQLIEENTKDVIIPFDKTAEDAIKQMRETGFPGENARKLQGYTVRVYTPEYCELEENGSIETLGERFHILVNPRLYSEKTGLVRVSGDDVFGGLLIS
ncbi:CRISPR-associated helicase Cas3' [uncultured Methanospirillum sp.]|uniref:CRISPR-associated helicase Cas3' n=1 Tax=uncultured Methanospirillum sp. TaxID=262503 RepID=UPI0029C6A092|nr:CRISPR-associated helicase Cas3' [uncultured Methanospirillum sp.]